MQLNVLYTDNDSCIVIEISADQIFFPDWLNNVVTDMSPPVTQNSSHKCFLIFCYPPVVIGLDGRNAGGTMLIF